MQKVLLRKSQAQRPTVRSSRDHLYLGAGDILLYRLDRLARSAETFQRLGGGLQRSWLPIIGGYLGRHHNVAWQTDDGPGRPCRIRASDPARTDGGSVRRRGIRFGRKPKLTPHQIAEALATPAT